MSSKKPTRSTRGVNIVKYDKNVTLPVLQKVLIINKK